MKTYNEKDFIDIIRKDLNPLSKEDFFKTKQLGELWDKLESDDIRKKLLKNKEGLYEWCYNFIHSDEPLELYFNKRLSHVDAKPIGIVEINNNTVKHKPNNVRLIRNINLQGMLDCEGADGKSIKNIYKDALERGKIDRCMTVPSVFKDSYEGNYDTFVVTLKTISGQMSVFSPTVYNSLLIETDKYAENKKQKLLIPSASWASPILATRNSENYTELHIVDVQSEVLKTSEELFKHIHTSGLFNETPYDLKTFCTPSEKMTDVIDKEYDKVFFCPPYYDLEVYGGSELQSTSLYKTYEEWLNLYWRKTVNECDSVLNSNGLFCFVMGRLCRGYEMGNDMKTIAEEKFTLKQEIKIVPPIESTRDSNSTIEKYEICYIMKKENK
jgi:tRNA1(Val) A37 N6-methylase TrmN6